MFDFIFKDWKTTIAGLSIAILTALKATGKITPEMYEIGFGILGALGFVAAHDGKTNNNV